MTENRTIAGQESNQGRCSEDKVSVHGTPALPTELIGAPLSNLLSIQKYMKFLKGAICLNQLPAQCMLQTFFPFC